MSAEDKRVAPYGTWESPITAKAVAAESFSAGIEEVIIDPKSANVYYAQKRPDQNGRSAIVCASDHQDFFGSDWDARTQFHEYGGGAATVFGDILIFSHIADHRVYKCNKGGNPEPVTPENQAIRYADFTVHPVHPHLVVCAVEDHTDPHPAKVLTRLVLINISTKTVSNLVIGADFYACPRFSPDGQSLIWQQWYFPEMPLQSSEIKAASVTTASDKQSLSLGQAVHAAGQTEKITAQDPCWASNTTAVFFCDASGFQNPWSFTFESGNIESGRAGPILPQPVAEEFGMPQWWLSRHGCGALTDTKVAVTSFREGRSVLYICDLIGRTLDEVPTRYAHIQYVRGNAQGKVVMLGQPADANEELVELTLDSQGKPVLKSLSPKSAPAGGLPLSCVSVSVYHALELGDRVCHVNYYPPTNPKYDSGMEGEKPPVVVLVHGGPFYMEPASLDWTKQFFTSRGWAHIDVNYGGSTGFGRAFRESLHGKWGVLDINDAYESVLKLDALGLLDAKRAVVHGGSAGGYAVLQIATSLPTSFAAGSPHYGVSDMRKLDEILHKFEYNLCDRLMGGTWDECKDVWIERSPIHQVNKIRMPLLFLQGKDDTVIPAEQMIDMVDTIKAQGGKVRLVLFPGEGHGWRKSSTVQTALEEELVFFNEVLGLDNKY